MESALPEMEDRYSFTTTELDDAEKADSGNNNGGEGFEDKCVWGVIV